MSADLNDSIVMRAMLARPSGIMTYVIRNILALEHGFRGLPTAAVLRRLKKLEAAGKVQRVRSSYAIQLCWAITDAGREVLGGEA